MVGYLDRTGSAGLSSLEPIRRIGSTREATHHMTGPTFSIQDIPFSCSGSWFDISPVVAEKTFADDLHLVSHQTGMHPILRFTPSAVTTVDATPTLLTWRHDTGRIDLVYERPDTIRLRG